MKIFIALLAFSMITATFSFAQNVSPARLYEQQRGTQSPVEGVWHVYDRNGNLLREENYENYDEYVDEWEGDEDDGDDPDKKIVYTDEDIALMKKEKADLENYRSLAKKIWQNSKGQALLIALKKGFEMTTQLGAPQKALIFTESTVTQNYLLKLLNDNGYKGKIVLFNGSNNDDKVIHFQIAPGNRRSHFLNLCIVF